MDDDKIKYSDLVSPDNSIKDLISQLEQLNTSFGIALNAIRAGAQQIAHAMKQASGATSESRAKIDEASIAANRLAAAEKELKFAMSDTGKEVAILKQKISDTNRMHVDLAKQTNALAGSYDRIKADLNENIKLWKAMSEEQRADADMGGKVLDTITALTSQLSSLNSQLKPVTASLSEVEKAEQRLAFLQSAEGEKLISLKKQIQEIVSGRKSEKTEIDKVAEAEQRLAAAKSSQNAQLQLLNTRINEANRISKLEAIIANAKIGSYNQLAAKYELNKIKLNSMSAEMRNAVDIGVKLERETLNIRKQMIHLQETTGDHRLSVGNYTKAWNGLGFAMSQVVRELPSLAINFQTFILAISNNLPILADEIQKVKEKNKLLREEGRPTESVVGAITKSIFSWQTLMIIGVTVLSKYGNQIYEFVKALFKGDEAVDTFEEAMKSLTKELETNGNKYGDILAKYEKLRTEWGKIDTLKEQEKWIRKNADAYNELGLKINSVNDANNAFIRYTPLVIESFQLRAKAEAAMSLAKKEYEKQLTAETKAEQLQREGVPFIFDDLELYLRAAVTPYSVDEEFYYQIQGFKREAQNALTSGNSFLALYNTFNDEAEEILKKLNLSGVSGLNKSSKSRGSERQPTDLTDRINKQTVALKQKQAEAITQLEEDELKKRERQAADAAEDAYNELQLQYNKNLELLAANLTAKNGVFTMGNKKYKQLTDEQVEQVRSQQAMILDIIKNNNIRLNKELEKIELERQKRTLELEAETIKLREDLVQKGTSDYIELKLKALENEYKQLLIANRLLPEAERQSETLLEQNYIAKLMQLLGQLDQTEFEAIQKLQKTEFEAGRPNERKRRLFERQQEIDALDYEIALAEQGSLVLSPTELAERRKRRENLMRDQKRDSGFSGLVGDVAEYGLGGAVLSSLGFDDEALSAAETAKDKIIGFLEEIMEANVRLAEIAVEKQQEQVDAAKEAYDAEVTARANGYANNVTTARKELELEKKKLADKNKQLEKAKRAQLAADTAMQTSSLITASAEIWKSMSGVPIVGPTLAAAALAAMWASFAFSKVKAVQVTKAESQTYGEGGLEFLEGGSHASGNDIDLAQKNSRGKNMRAEGGEALAIINKRNTRKYKKELPSIIKALNKGSFEDVYTKAFDRDRFVAPILLMQGKDTADLSRLEREVSQIRKQGEHSRYSLPDGSVLVINKNVRRIIKH